MMCVFHQMEVYGSMDILLTPKQRSWMNALKNAATKKPTRKIERPTVKSPSLIYRDVKHARTATGRDHFACQGRGVSQIFIFIIPNGERILSNVNVVA